ncbi:hypothetical protein BLNAU_5736 [Blattamonas nauphoetae]|uniref:Uncharacterized protein n=1 Tax=Blattamonas nauphoetae TaxID=2049346 RepID=A0ABQ9Y624_9EUKA|nr:hypothetical protein BLNAU_5736 [Blattamonas nauphoetae]
MEMGLSPCLEISTIVFNTLSNCATRSRRNVSPLPTHLVPANPSDPLSCQVFYPVSLCSILSSRLDWLQTAWIAKNSDSTREIETPSSLHSLGLVIKQLSAALSFLDAVLFNQSRIHTHVCSSPSFSCSGHFGEWADSDCEDIA